MALADFGKLRGGVTVARANLAQIFAGHAIEAINGLTVVAGGDQQFVERLPIVSPIEIEADALAEFAFINLTAPPLFEDVLIAGKDGFHSQHNRAIPHQSALLEQRCCIALRAGQSVVVTDQNHVGGVQSILNLLRVENRIVAAEGLVELAQIFTAAVRVLRTDFALDSRQRVKLRYAATGS